MPETRDDLPPLYEGTPQPIPPPAPGRSSRDFADVLAVIPLPARVDVAAAVMRAVADVWETRHDQTLTMADVVQGPTPWGPALIIREPQQAGGDTQ